MRALRALLPVVFAVALVPLAAGAASAAPPANDEATGAFPIHLGDRVKQDTTGATTTPADASLNESKCGAPAMNASVWYVYAPTADHNLVLDTSESHYTTGVMVFKGAPTAKSFISCAPGGVGLHAHAGKTYTIMVFSDSDAIGGRLVLRAINAPTPHARVTLDKRGVAFHGGAAQLHGTYSCTHADSFAGVTAHLYQRAGRLKIQADGSAGVRCNGKLHHWSARLVSPIGTYAKGPAVARVRIVSCGLLQCRQDHAKRHVDLAWSTKPQRAWMADPTTARQERPSRVPARQHSWPGGR